MRVEGVPGWAIRSANLGAYLSEFTEAGRYTLDDILDQIATGDRQCWIVTEAGAARAVALTKISDERFKTCHITHLTGDGLREWHSAFAEIERWAVHMGCSKIEAIARPGYERVGKRYGLRKTHVLLEKDLTHGQ